MIWLVLGVLGWSTAHLFPCVARPARNRAAERLGPAYQGVFALTIVLSLVLMVAGWRSAVPGFVYTPPAWGRLAANLLVFIGFVLFAASALPSNLRRWIRHPQLTGFATWAVAHLLANGDSRSLVLFGGLGLWAVVAVWAINRRDGAWQKPEAQPISAELKLGLVSVAAFALVYLAHPWIAGVSPVPR